MPPAYDHDLVQIQEELAAVKNALRVESSSYLGLKGETLQRYLLQLNEKENLILSRQLRYMQVGGDGDLEQGGLSVLLRPEERPLMLGGSPARPPPSGPVRTFDKDDIESILAHMIDYEGVILESARALRATSVLAYNDAVSVGGNSRMLAQIMRLLSIHADEVTVQNAGVRALCNIAYDASVSLKYLTNPHVLSVLLLSASVKLEDDKADAVRAKAGETIARIVAAETCDAEKAHAEHSAKGGATNGEQAGATKVRMSGPWVEFFLAGACVQASQQKVVPVLVSQLLNNEVADLQTVADRFVLAGRVASSRGDQAAAGWLALAGHMAASEECQDLPQRLTDSGAISAAARLMEVFLSYAGVQLAGVEALSALVGSRWASLQAFANQGGMPCIEAAVRSHISVAIIQTKGIRALASGLAWPEDIQKTATYHPEESVLLTKVAMKQHMGDVELQIAGLDALGKYLEKGPPVCKENAKRDNCAGLVKEVLARHDGNVQVQKAGNYLSTLLADGL